MKRKRKKERKIWIYIFLSIIAFIYISIFAKDTNNVPKNTLKTYMSYIVDKKYEEMYNLINTSNIDKETYISRNKNIYEGIEISDIKVNIVRVTEKESKTEIIYI